MAPGAVRGLAVASALVLLGAAALVSCSDDDPAGPVATTTTERSAGGSTASSTSTTARPLPPNVPPNVLPGGAEGPRDLPPTFVSLELDAFPRPAAEACADNDHEVAVGPGDDLAAAIEGASPGDVVRVAAGTYHAHADEPTALSWDVDDLCVIGDGDVVLQAAEDQPYGIALRGDDAVLSGMRLVGFSSAIGLGGEEGTTQRRVTIEDVTVDGLVGGFREAIVAYTDNRSLAGDGTGAPASVDGLLLFDVTVTGADLGVSCNAGPCAHWWLERTSIVGRTGSEDSGADAFAIEEGRQIVVLDSTVTGAAADGIDTKATDVVVYRSSVLDVERNGIKLWHGGDVIDTVVDGTGADAALVGDQAGRYRYLHVLVTHHGAPGDSQYVATWGYDHPDDPGYAIEVVNSVFAANATGGWFVPAGADVSVRHTLFADEGAKLLETSDGTLWSIDADGLTALEAQGWGSGNVIGDPGLIGGDHWDLWMPSVGSPLIDAGEPVDDLATDRFGFPRVAGPAPDLGPVERPE